MKDNCMVGPAINLYWPARCVAWNPTGDGLAVGFYESVKGGFKSGGSSSSSNASKGKKKGGSSKEAITKTSGTSDDHEHKGAVELFSVKYDIKAKTVTEIKKKAQGCQSIAWIADIKFSPETGRFLAAGSHDSNLYLYDLSSASNPEDWTDAIFEKRFFKFDKHSSAVIHFDFSLDEKYIQSNCQAGELLFSEIPVETANDHKVKQITSASKLADYNGLADDDDDDSKAVWATQTCVLGWSVQGIWPPGVDTTEINACDKHISGKFIATADDSSHVKLFRFPSVQEGSKYLTFDGHSSHVTNVKWTVGNHLISSGGNDKCIFVWQMNET